MDVLGFLLFLAVSLPGRTLDLPLVVDILFDEANPEASVAIMKDAVLEEGDFYRNYRIISFEPAAVVVRENETEDTLKWLKEDGFTLLRDKPFRGADNKMVCFIHPKSSNGVLVELCQEIK